MAMTVSNLPSDGSGGKRNPLPFTALGITAEHVGALYRAAMVPELRKIRSAARHKRTRPANRYMLAFDLVEVLSDVVSAGKAGFDASDHEVTQEHLEAVRYFEKDEKDRVANSWKAGGRRPSADRDRLGDVVEFVRAIVEAEDAA